jgi:hypothetical protein
VLHAPLHDRVMDLSSSTRVMPDTVTLRIGICLVTASAIDRLRNRTTASNHRRPLPALRDIASRRSHDTPTLRQQHVYFKSSLKSWPESCLRFKTRLMSRDQDTVCNRKTRHTEQTCTGEYAKQPTCHQCVTDFEKRSPSWT